MPRTYKPLNLKVISGTVEKSREATQAPEFPPVTDFPAAPQHLNPDGAQMWDHLGRLLMATGVLQEPDLYALEQVCCAWSRFREKAKKGIDITASEDNALKALWGEFGLTPAARRRVVASTETPKGNRFSQHGKRPA